MSETEFTRDPEVENGAVNLLGMTADQVHRTRIEVLRQMMKTYFEKQQQQLSVPATVAEQRPMDIPPPPAHQEAMTPSELGMLDPLSGSAGIRQALAVIPENDDDFKGLEYLLTPININAWCQQTDGLTKLAKHIHKVLEVASDFEQAVREKKQIINDHRSALDTEDIEEITRSMQVDARQLGVVFKWITAVLDDISQLIRMRLEVQNKFQQIRRGNNVTLCDKMHAKTLKLRAMHSALSARSECLQIPKLIGGDQHKLIGGEQ